MTNLTHVGYLCAVDWVTHTFTCIKVGQFLRYRKVSTGINVDRRGDYNLYTDIERQRGRPPPTVSISG